MKKNGFTFIEIIVVIALLGAIMLLVVPNITKNFKESKKKLFYDNVLGIYSSASRTYFSQDNASNKSFSNTGVKLDVDISDDITYRVKVDSYGAVLSIYVTDGTYTYKLDNANGISKKDIKLANVIEGVIEGKVDSYLTLYEQLLEDNPTIKTRTDFNATFTETNTGTLYKATESIAGSTPKDVYYFAGNATNNWVKFAGFYWRIIRTNHDGSVRLLYSGTSHNTTYGHIGSSAFNSTYNDPMYVGYMYGTSGSLASNRDNTNNSTIKAKIDDWYSTNLSSYSKYISTEAVYCNDRELARNQTYSTSSGSSSIFNYAPYGRLYTNKTPKYNCANKKDAFSGSNNEAKLTYPIGLMTADEIAYAGGKAYTDLPSPYAWFYLNSAGESITGSTYWWSLSPSAWGGSYSYVWFVFGSSRPGYLFNSYVSNIYGVRPAISLKTCTLWINGNGAPETPYEISTTSGC
mgnify:CR=1 FL=1